MGDSSASTREMLGEDVYPHGEQEITLEMLNQRELIEFKKESSQTKFQTQDWRKKSVSEPIFRKWSKQEHTRFVQAVKLLGLSSATAKFDVLWTKMTEYVGSRSLSDIELHARVYFALLDTPMKQPTDSHTNQFCSDANAASTDANSFRIPLMPLSSSQYKTMITCGDFSKEIGQESDLPCKASTKRKSESTINKDKRLKMDVSISNKSVGGTDSQDNVLVHSLESQFCEQSGSGKGLSHLLLDTLAEELLGQNARLIESMRTNVLAGHFTPNLSHMRRFAHNISLLLKCISNAGASISMPPLPVKLNTYFFPSSIPPVIAPLRYSNASTSLSLSLSLSGPSTACSGSIPFSPSSPISSLLTPMSPSLLSHPPSPNIPSLSTSGSRSVLPVQTPSSSSSFMPLSLPSSLSLCSSLIGTPLSLPPSLSAASASFSSRSPPASSGGGAAPSRAAVQP